METSTLLKTDGQEVSTSIEMALLEQLKARANDKCELCSGNDTLSEFQVYPFNDEEEEHSVLACENCQHQINNPEAVDINHWRCLNDSMWSEVNAVKVVVWRMLDRIKSEGWPADLQDMMYLEDDIRNWAEQASMQLIHKDSNGAVLSQGDNVTLIKDLDVKGANFTAKRGTSVRNIRLVDDNAEHIEGKVEGQRIVILTKFVKKL